MEKYGLMLNLQGKEVLDIGIAGDPKLPGATSRSEKYKWFGPGNHFQTLDNDPAWEPDIIGDICAAPFGDNQFDLVILSECLEHIYDFRQALAECYRITKPGGHFILTTPWMVEHHPTGFTADYWRFSKQAYEKLLGETKFQIENLYSSNLIGGALCIK